MMTDLCYHHLLIEIIAV